MNDLIRPAMYGALHQIERVEHQATCQTCFRDIFVECDC